ncbi:MAG: CCA tRNA nucleotidyltransferase [Dehalococcoidia bacterium]|nr:CCA tRNA nucleotidyltransferase [Dehalococcoidia bacterium]
MRGALSEGLRDALEAVLALGGAEVWAVGGGVRDIALRRPIVDLDLVSTGDIEALAQAAAHALAGSVEVHQQFGTASVSGAAGRIDFARARTETYARPGALPDPHLGVSVEADLGRRDFSVNAIALCLAGSREDQVLDPHGGLADLEAGRLRVLHAASFRDDATRIWRGARYAVRLGLRPDDTTLAALAEGIGWLASVSGERLWAEFERLAEEPAPGRVIALLEDWGGLEGTVAGLSPASETHAALARRRGPIPLAVLAAVLLAPLDAGVRERAVERFNPPREVVRAVEETRALLDCAGVTPEALAPLEGTSGAAKVAARWLAPGAQRALQRDLGRWERTRPTLTPAELEQLGIAPGPVMGEWLRRLRRERFLGTLHTRAQARRLVRDSMERGDALGVDDAGTENPR